MGNIVQEACKAALVLGPDWVAERATAELDHFGQWSIYETLYNWTLFNVAQFNTILKLYILLQFIPEIIMS